MNTLRLFLADLRKLKLTWIWLVVLGLPLGANAAMLFDMSLRYRSYLVPRGLERGFTSWQMLLIEHHHVLMWGAFLPVFVAIISALVYTVEFQHHAWRQLVSLPLSRLSVYLSKWLTILFFLFWMLALDTAGLLLVGLLFRFPEPLPLGLMARYAGFQLVVALAIAALHNWLSSYHQNLITPVAVGFVGTIVSYTLYYTYPKLSGFFFYTYTIYAGDIRQPVPAFVLLVSLMLALIFLVFGWLEFRRRSITM